MRWYYKVMMVAAVGFVVVQLSTAQQPSFFGGMGKGGPSVTPSIFQNESVKKELKLTDEQLAKIPDAVMKALGEVLDKGQMKRLEQISLQLKGPRAFADPKVQKHLKIGDEQADNIKLILADADKELAALAKEMQKEIESGSFNIKGIQAIRDRMTAINKDLKDRVASVLTADQKRNWQEMIGDDFKLEQPKFGFDKK